MLLLDESTNNLDTETQAWLVNHLKNFHGLVLFVSHNRNFINQVAEQIIVIKDGNLELFHGNYHAHQTREAQIHNQLTKNYLQAQKTKKHLNQKLNRLEQTSTQTGKQHFNKYQDESRMAFKQQRSNTQNFLT